jgi:hypothetical protein
MEAQGNNYPKFANSQNFLRMVPVTVDIINESSTTVQSISITLLRCTLPSHKQGMEGLGETRNAVEISLPFNGNLW